MKISTTDWNKLQDYFFINKKLSTKSSAVSALKSRHKVLASFFETNDLEFNRANFMYFLSILKEKGLQPSYINNFIKMAKHIDNFYKLNEMSDFTYFREKKTTNYDVLTPEEILLLANTKIRYQKYEEFINRRQRALILLMGTTGCRVGEALALRTSDVLPNPCHVILKDTKNGSDRAVPIDRAIFDELHQISHTNQMIFVSGRGGALDPQQVNLDLKVRAKACGIKKNVWAHLFRHSFITTMLEAGVDLSDVGVLVGHADPRSTMRYKNSQLQHYSNIILLHPIIRKGLPLATVSKRMREYMDKLIDLETYQVETNETDDTLTISIKKGVDH